MTLAKSEVDYKKISELADIIWREHYITIISEAQIDYMLVKFNSPEAIKSQINQGALFYIIKYQDIPVGYVAVKKETDYLFLSKLYVLSSYRGKKIGKAAMQHVNDLAKSFHLKSIKLHVNKYNTNSILAYEKLGFVKTRALVSDIGNGFVMDDYEMEKVLSL